MIIFQLCFCDNCKFMKFLDTLCFYVKHSELAKDDTSRPQGLIWSILPWFVSTNTFRIFNVDVLRNEL